MLTIIIFSTSFAIAWVCYLTQPNDIFDFFPIWVEKIMPYRKYKKLHKILYICERCIAGQISFWTYMTYIISGVFSYDFIEHMITVMCSISITGIIGHIIQKIKQ